MNTKNLNVKHIPHPSNPKVRYATNEMTVTVPYTLFNDLVMKFELNCQDDLDACITSFIEAELDKQTELDTMAQYYEGKVA